MEKKADIWSRVASSWHRARPVLNRAGATLRQLTSWVYKLRSVILAIPVAVAAVVLAIRNLAVLPAEVGINLLANGEYAFTVGKLVAVMGPLAVTALSLLLVFCSRRTLYPWLISVFTLVLPLLLWITNVFPA